MVIPQKTTIHNPMKRTILYLALFCSITIAFAQKPVLHYDFKASKNTVVVNKANKKMNGELKGSAKLVKEGKVTVVDLGNDGGYIDMGKEIGVLMKNAEAFTVAVKYFVREEASLKGNGYFLWAFSTMEQNTKTEGRYHAYKLNIQRSENSVGGWTRETLMDVGKPSVKGMWQYAVYTQDGADGRLYVNGELVASNKEMFTMSTTFPDEAPTYNWLGRAPFNGDAFLSGTLIQDVRVYTKALSEEDVKKLAKKLLK